MMDPFVLRNQAILKALLQKLSLAQILLLQESLEPCNDVELRATFKELCPSLTTEQDSAFEFLVRLAHEHEHPALSDTITEVLEEKLASSETGLDSPQPSGTLKNKVLLQIVLADAPLESVWNLMATLISTQPHSHVVVLAREGHYPIVEEALNTLTR